MKKANILLCFSAALLCISMTGCKSDDYKKAVESYENGAYDEAKTKFSAIEDYKDSAEYLDHIYVIGAYDEVKGAGETSLSQVLEKFDGHDTDFDNEISSFVSQVKELDKMSGEYKYKSDSGKTYTFSMDLYLKNGSFYAQPHTDLYGGEVYEAEIVPTDGEYKFQTNPQGEHYLEPLFEGGVRTGPFETYFDIKVSENTVRAEWSIHENSLGDEDNTYYIFTR